MPVFYEQPELLQAFRRGERRAMERVYRFYVRQVEVYLRSLARQTSARELAQPSALADLLQDTFIHAFNEQARDSFDGLREYGPYLRTIARNCFIDMLRKRRREVLQTPEDLSVAISVDAHSDVVYEPRVVAVLKDYLENLPHALVGVYEQRFVLGRSQQAVCDALGLSRRNLRTRENHLRRGLKKALVHAGIYQTAGALGTTLLPASR